MRIKELLASFMKGGAPALPNYILVERVISPEFTATGVRIEDGPFAGMVFTSAPNVQFKPNDDGTISLSYTYHIEVFPKNRSALDAKQALDKLIGDIILDIISKNYKESNDANRDNNPVGFSKGF